MVMNIADFKDCSALSGEPNPPFFLKIQRLDEDICL